MEELTKHKIFTMDAMKRDTLFTVAMSKFAKSGYKKTTTDEIISEAEISKGLLFHYFGTKKDLYIFLFEYANTTIMQDFYGQINIKEKDILERLRKMFLLKIELTNKYPAIFDFVASAFYEKDPTVATKISKYTNQLYSDAQKEIFKDIDLSLFKENIDTHKAVNIIIYTFRGYSEAQASPEKRTEDYRKEYKRYIKDINEYITMLRAAFYKEGE
ncbi:TetR/AcrR family transcriptional regulator [Clostridium ljungdahlii]|uniref:HTH-type transcriptional regulator QacR n=1 Tax=Clostridium ljungdahlii TaxID=1538 RepID=A0A162L0H6_9CLOT|nr:TetR/AcrR family transcriptional regulator [Clostridium ljungdahlii]OAA86796.1 HTH-type transcriptional regulator QacR [Clostridium ljungdahlii]